MSAISLENRANREKLNQNSLSYLEESWKQSELGFDFDNDDSGATFVDAPVPLVSPITQSINSGKQVEKYAGTQISNLISKFRRNPPLSKETREQYSGNRSFWWLCDEPNKSLKLDAQLSEKVCGVTSTQAEKPLCEENLVNFNDRVEQIIQESQNLSNSINSLKLEESLQQVHDRGTVAVEVRQTKNAHSGVDILQKWRLRKRKEAIRSTFDQRKNFVLNADSIRHKSTLEPKHVEQPEKGFKEKGSDPIDCKLNQSLEDARSNLRASLTKDYVHPSFNSAEKQEPSTRASACKPNVSREVQTSVELEKIPSSSSTFCSKPEVHAPVVYYYPIQNYPHGFSPLAIPYHQPQQVHSFDPNLSKAPTVSGVSKKSKLKNSATSGVLGFSTDTTLTNVSSLDITQPSLCPSYTSPHNEKSSKFSRLRIRKSSDRHVVKSSSFAKFEVFSVPKSSADSLVWGHASVSEKPLDNFHTCLDLHYLPKLKLSSETCRALPVSRVCVEIVKTASCSKLSSSSGVCFSKDSARIVSQSVNQQTTRGSSPVSCSSAIINNEPNKNESSYSNVTSDEPVQVMVQLESARAEDVNVSQSKTENVSQDNTFEMNSSIDSSVSFECEPTEEEIESVLRDCNVPEEEDNPLNGFESTLVDLTRAYEKTCSEKENLEKLIKILSS